MVGLRGVPGGGGGTQGLVTGQPQLGSRDLIMLLGSVLMLSGQAIKKQAGQGPKGGEHDSGQSPKGG